MTTPPAPDIDHYRPPRHHGGWIAAAVVVVVAVVLVLVARHVDLESQLGPTPSPTPIPTTATPSASALTPSIAPSATAAPSSIPFTISDEQVEGTWSIDDVDWGATTVSLTMTIHVTRGTFSDYDFIVMENEGTAMHQPDERPSGTLGQPVQTGQTVTGTVVVTCPHTSATVLLTRPSQRVDAIAALTIRS